MTQEAQGCTDACEEALERLEAYLDGELPESDVGEIRAHLAECCPCMNRTSFEELLRSIVRRDCTEKAPASLLARIEVRLAEGSTQERT